MHPDKKIQAIKNLCQYTNTTPTKLLDPYNQTIPNTNLNQKDLFIALINNKTTETQNEYIQQNCNLPHKDNRTPHEYARELTINWLLEDLTQQILTQNQIKNRKHGADKNRQYLPPHKITPHTDLQIKQNNETIRNLETIYDHTQHWHRTQQIDLRHQKHQHLTQQKALLLAIDTQNLTATIIDYTNPPKTIMRQHPTYAKPVHTISITTPLQPITETLNQLKTQ